MPEHTTSEGPEHTTSKGPPGAAGRGGEYPEVDIGEVAQRLRVVVSRLGRRLRQSPSAAELSPSQYEVLSTVVVRGPLRVAELVDLETLNPTMVSRIVGKLEGAGLLSRTQDRDDARVTHVEATAPGRRLVIRVRKERDESVALLLAELDDSQRSCLVRALPALEKLAEVGRDRSGGASR